MLLDIELPASATSDVDKTFMSYWNHNRPQPHATAKSLIRPQAETLLLISMVVEKSTTVYTEKTT